MAQAQAAAAQQVQQALPALPALPNNAMPASAQPMVQQAMSAAQSMVQQATATAAGQGAAASAQPVASMPSVIPVPTPAPSVTDQAQSVVSSGYIVPSAGVDEKIAAVSANSERLVGQLQGQYTQQYNEFSNQTRAVQDQIQALTARVSVIESQLNQLIQALTKRNAGASLNAPTRLEQPQTQATEAKIAYNVQAIIPGRAWLKSDSGETLTVAEGDSIKGVGRVTKIDPYDGVVEINTGNKSVSLSYGESA
jgi:intracellular multiplication protein IcmG